VTKQIPIISEDQFLARIHQHEEEQQLLLIAQQQQQQQQQSQVMMMEVEEDSHIATMNPTNTIIAGKPGLGVKQSPSNSSNKTATKLPSSFALHGDGDGSNRYRSTERMIVDKSDMLWVDKYKPTSSSQLIGEKCCRCLSVFVF
jgi:hypothetical protein